MKKSTLLFPLFLFAFLTLSAQEPAPYVPRDSNIQNTPSFGPSKVEARLLVHVKDGTDKVHFIRDNNDPRVVTKAYLIKNADPYDLRDYLRQMVQSKRVGNTSMQQIYPENAVSNGTGTAGTNPGIGTSSAANVAATVSYPAATTPANAQSTFSPALQLGSNTAVECLQYVDGTSLLIVSAEEYRFKDHKNGMGIDSMIAFLDKKGMGSSFGTQVFFYLPKYVPAKNLVSLIQNVGMNVVDVTELWQGQDLVTYDPALNFLIFDVSNYSCNNIAELLAQYDVPLPQLRLKVEVWEAVKEDDEKMGLDFQAWKNNDGASFLSGGARFRNNWSALYSPGGNMAAAFGSERTSFFNFNPKWNTRYLDFLASRGRAKVLASGELLIRNNTPALLERSSRIFYMAGSENLSGTLTTPDAGVGPYELLSSLIGTIRQKFSGNEADTVANGNIPVGKGKKITTVQSASFGFTMQISNARVNLKETLLNVTISNSSLIGFQSDGTPRISSPSVTDLEISLPHGKDRFVIGGIKKQEKVTSSSGIPFLSDIPILGYLFSSKTTRLREAELIVMASLERESPPEGVATEALRRKERKR